MAARNARIYRLVPAGLMDRTDQRVTAFAGKEVQKIQPAGCPRNGTMHQCYVQVVETGEFVGMVNEASLVDTGRTGPVRDLAAEARERRSASFGRRR